MITRREAALRLGIPLEMATRHGIPGRVPESEIAAMDQDPPAWLAQSRANATGKRPEEIPLTPPRVLAMLLGREPKVELPHIARAFADNVIGRL